MSGLELGVILETMGQLVPPCLAAPWDNVGLLLEPRLPGEELVVHRGLLTIDLSSAVLAEARLRGAELLICYHPPIFRPWKRLVPEDEQQQLVMQCLRERLAIYAPHTALDSVVGGVNDWLMGVCEAVDATPLEASTVIAGAGQGRRGRFAQPVNLTTAVARVKAGLGLPWVRVASAPNHRAGGNMETVAVCPGAGGSLLAPLRGVDLLLTGEMRHHDLLALNAAGTSVILTDHSNTERGYLPHFGRWLTGAMPQVSWDVSAQDRDPLEVC